MTFVGYSGKPFWIALRCLFLALFNCWWYTCTFISLLLVKKNCAARIVAFHNTHTVQFCLTIVMCEERLIYTCRCMKIYLYGTSLLRAIIYLKMQYLVRISREWRQNSADIKLNKLRNAFSLAWLFFLARQSLFTVELSLLLKASVGVGWACLVLQNVGCLRLQGSLSTDD